MTAKEYLLQYREIQEEIVCIIQQIAEIESLLDYHPVQLDDSGASKSNFREDKMSSCMAEVADLYAELREKNAKLILKKQEIRERVNQLTNPNEREVLDLRYLTKHPKRDYAPIGWKEISKRMNYSIQNVQKIHVTALKHMEEIIK